MTSWVRRLREVLSSVLVLLLIAPVAAWPATASLGTARGVRGVEISLDAGKTWLPLGGRSLPILDGTQLRSTTGGALLDLADGSRVNVLPFSSVRVRETGAATEVSLLYGRVGFRLPERTLVEIRTPTARLLPSRHPLTAGEVFVGGDGTTGVKTTQGDLQVQELAGDRRSLLASVEPVFVPKRPVASGPLFGGEGPVAPPAGAKAVFNPRGESLGWLRPDAQLVVHPGYTADLTQPFPAKLVQLAAAKIPEAARSDAMPLFDVHGGYLGYLAGPVFHAQAQLAPPPQPGQPQGQVQVAQAILGEGGGMAGLSLEAWIALGLGFGGLAGFAAYELTSGGGGTAGGGPIATPLRPRR